MPALPLTAVQPLQTLVVESYGARISKHSQRLRVIVKDEVQAEAPLIYLRYGFIYYIPARRARRVPITPDLRQAVYGTLTALIQAERYPDPPSDRWRCAACEFRRFCNDI